jgi:lipoate-protein ligase A
MVFVVYLTKPLMSFQFRLLNLGALKPITTQTIYHAIAEAVGREDVPPTLVICWPDTPNYPGIVCCGYMQDIAQEVDLEYCQSEGLLVVRRILGGGAVYLDGGQIFYQLMAPRNHPVVPPSTNKFFEKILEAPVATYRAIGVDAVYSPVNDIKTPLGQKISGNGIGYWEGAAVLTGNLIETFDAPLMARVLKVPDEKFRDKMVQNLQSYLGTIRDLAPDAPPREQIVEMLIQEFARVLDANLELGELTAEEDARCQELEAYYVSDEWLNLPQYQRAKRVVGRAVKISGGLYLARADYKALGGMIRATAEVQGTVIQSVEFNGDFHLNPPEALYDLELALKGADLVNAEAIQTLIGDFFRDNEVESPGVTPFDFVDALMGVYQEVKGRE